MAEFPLDPMLSKAVIAAEKYGCVDEVRQSSKRTHQQQQGRSRAWGGGERVAGLVASTEACGSKSGSTGYCDKSDR